MREFRLPVVLTCVLLSASLVRASEQADTWSRVGELPLLELPGDLVPVRYSAGSLHRATQLQAGFELLADLFRSWSNRREQLPLILLNRDEWERAGIGQPYGLMVRPSRTSIAVAAWGDEGTVELWNRLLNGDLPTLEDTPLRSTVDEAGSLVPSDYLALFEGSRILLEAAGYRGAEPWIADVAAHTVAVGVIARLTKGTLEPARSVYRQLGARAPGRRLGLADYTAGLSLEEWLWFQAHFFEAAASILADEGRGTGKSMVKLIRSHEGRIGRAELLSRYEAVAPWMSERFAATAE